jgi:translation initiation factor IF-3
MSHLIFRLMSGAEYHIEDLKRREEKKEAKKSQSVKGEKLLSLSSKISDHDLQVCILGYHKC